jgi:GAF domain-containing protein
MKQDKAAAGDGSLARALRRLVLAIEASGRAILPDSGEELLQTIVDAAARLFGAAASSIALVDDRQRTLEFRVATGVGREQVLGMRIPIDQGIAGYVAMTGQPMAISDVQQDPRFAQKTAEKTGYVPRSILAMPLLIEDRVIGVIEVLDKINAPSFGMQDMELLGIFARQAAIAIHAAQQYQRLGQALVQGLRELAAEEGNARVQETLQALAEPAQEDDAGDDLMAMATVLASVGKLGPAERRACLQVLAAFAGYAESRAGYA